MDKYIVEVSKTAKNDLGNIISYIRNSLFDDIIADKYKILFKQELLNIENIAGSMPVLDKNLTGHDNIRKINVKNYVIFYIVNKNKASILRISHAFMDWEKFLKE
ncbi:MAG: type II toxin-antitoxin system RelE/ParE family toxin [Clostridia bacterium]|nr:type II toxin-antitoxin system RelE/ParE family toxin [Clostridia bacterium]